MATLENADKKLSTLINEIETGQIKIPQFQRKFVWSVKEAAKLIDSIIKGYPIGTFIYWRTKDRLRSIRNVGSLDLPEPITGEFVNYVLDGQQRITSIFAAIKGEKVKFENGSLEDFTEIYIDFEASEDEQIVFKDINDRKEGTYISLTNLMDGGISFLNEFPTKYHEKIDTYKEVLSSYTFTGVNLKKADIDVATEVFTRLNVGGKSLTLFEIMVAKTYDPEKEFDLAIKYDELIEDLKQASYETIRSSTVLQVVSILIRGECSRREILKLDRAEFIKMWPKAVDCIKKTVDFFRSFGIPVSRLLPYYSLVVPFSYFFYKHPHNPSSNMKKYLEDFFWRCSLGFRYSSAAETRLATDCEKIDTILEEEQQPDYEWSVPLTSDYLVENGGFSTGKSIVKAILALFAKQKPKSFNNHMDVTIDNSWLKIATSKNYHHFFPKSYMKKNHPKVDYDYVNHIANITIVDDFLNKRKIGSKAPADYMKTFKKENDELEATMKTHLIDDLNEFGVWDDDYQTFFNKRIQKIVEVLNDKIIPQNNDEFIELEEYEDVEVTAF